MKARARTWSRLQSSIAAAFYVLTLLLVSVPSSARETSRSEAEALTRSLVALGGAYRRGNTDKRADLIPSLSDAATKRRELLAELILSNPGEVLRVALTSERLQQLPEIIKAKIEQRVVVEGRLEVRYEDGARGARIIHSVEKDGARYPLYFKHQPTSALHSGMKVKLRGVLVPAQSGRGGSVAIESQNSILTLSAGGGSTGGSNEGAPGPFANTFGNQSTLVLLVNFRNDPANKPWTLAQAEDLVFGQVSEFLLENSYGQTWLSGEVHGWYTIDQDNTVWNADDLAAKANAAASAAGVNVAAFTRILYAFPRNSGASFSGSGTVGGIPSKAWFNGKFDLAVVGHELGHNFGLQHAHALECGTATVGAIGQGCVSYEYGDHLDIMGNVNAGHFNAFEKSMLGWIGYGSSPTLITVQSAGTQALAPYELSGAGSHALRIPKGIDAVTGAQTWYYLEYRQPVGFDAFLAGAGIPAGVGFHIGTEGDARSSYQLDMTPASNSDAFYDWDDTALVAGNSFTDAAAGVSITTTATNSGEARVDVSFGTASCVHTHPSISVLPEQSAWLAPGSTATFDVMLSNRDSAACTSSAFDMSASAPSGWIYAYADPRPSLSPGSSMTTRLTVTSPASAVDGFYDISLKAHNVSQAGFEATETVTYVVSRSGSGSTNTAPVAENDSATLPSVSGTVINVLGNDYDADADLLTVASVTQGSRGSVSIRTDGTLYYQPGKSFKGSDTFSYSITDGVATATATVNVSLQASSGGGGGGGKPGGRR